MLVEPEQAGPTECPQHSATAEKAMPFNAFKADLTQLRETAESRSVSDSSAEEYIPSESLGLSVTGLPDDGAKQIAGNTSLS